jgi:anti-sigma regulatory factor (Ser/Thr protein kinase)
MLIASAPAQTRTGGHPHEPRGPQRMDRLELAAVPSAVPIARLLVVAVLRCWGYSSMVDDATLVVSELVTNVVRHVAPGRALTYGDLLDVRRTVVTVVDLGPVVCIEVFDHDPTPPVVRTPGLHDEGGRGLHLVAELGLRWGFDLTHGGKVVWCQLSVPEEPTVVIDRRPAPAARPDLATLRRVAVGLHRLDV